ncbi:MAG: hypothetical protein QOI76_3644 [Frankiales bacterium]|jgi:uncharacterized protein (AIM24 family)|nr:hypothetical protein [Frankiales bacterium]
MAQPLNPQTLPVDDNINPYSFCIDLHGEWFMQKGAMIAYYGQMRFESLSAYASVASFVAARFSSPLYVQDWVVATGQGKLVLGDRGFDINSYDLGEGNLTIRAANLLAFETTLELKQSIVPGFVTLLGSGKFLASSNGPVIFLEPPVRVDPQALLGWADCPSPSHHYDTSWMHGFLGALQGHFGRESGEERQYDFTGTGTVLLQSSEKQRADGNALRLVQAQAEQLAPAQMQQLGTSLIARAAAEQR